jgi:hypothetical protein
MHSNATVDFHTTNLVAYTSSLKGFPEYRAMMMLNKNFHVHMEQNILRWLQILTMFICQKERFYNLSRICVTVGTNCMYHRWFSYNSTWIRRSIQPSKWKHISIWTEYSVVWIWTKGNSKRTFLSKSKFWMNLGSFLVPTNSTSWNRYSVTHAYKK